MGLALDESNDKEIIFQENGLTILADGRLQDEMRRAGGMTIDFAGAGRRDARFVVTLVGASGCG